MTHDEIPKLTLREIDALIWQLLHNEQLNLGNCRYVDGDVQPNAGYPIGHVSPEHYSSDIGMAWKAVDKITDPKQMTREMYENMSNSRFGYWWDDAHLWAMTVEEAAHWISQHALLAVMEK